MAAGCRMKGSEPTVSSQLWADGTLALVGRGKRARLCVANEGSLRTLANGEPPHGNTRIPMVTKPGELSPPELATVWMDACGCATSHFIHHKTWRRFVRLLLDVENGWGVEVLDEQGQPFDGRARPDTKIRLRAPLPPRRVEDWSVFDPFSRRFRFDGAIDDAQPALHERLSRELMTRGPVLVIVKGMRPSSGDTKPVSEDAFQFIRTLLGAYAMRRGGAGVRELNMADQGSWSVAPAENVVLLTAPDPTLPSLSSALEHLRAQVRWSCSLVETEQRGGQLWLDWLRILSGTPLTGARLWPARNRLSDAELVRRALDRLGEALVAASHRQPGAKAGGRESEEHLGCKAAIFGRLVQESKEGDRVVAEWSSSDDSIDALSERLDEPTLARVDLAVLDSNQESLHFVEVETFRWSKDQDPFARVLRRLVNKAEVLDEADVVELVVPPVVAALAPRPVCRVATALRERLTKCDFRTGTVDLGDGNLVLLSDETPPKLAYECLPSEAADATVDKVAESHGLTWKSVAGYDRLKAFVRDDVQTVIERAEELDTMGLSLPGGVLLFGPPGTGKSRLARALAGELNRPVRFMRPSDFISKWLGEGVERIREHADWAIKNQPTVLIIDELDAIAPSRTGDTSAHQDTLAMVNELLTQLDRLKQAKEVLIVATTNAMERIDPAVLRAGRFEFKLPVGPPNADDRRMIFQHYLGEHSASIPATVLDDWIAETEFLVAADIGGIVELARRRQVTRDPDRPLEVLVADAMHDWSKPNVETLRAFLSDTRRYASRFWQEQFRWLSEHSAFADLLPGISGEASGSNPSDVDPSSDGECN